HGLRTATASAAKPPSVRLPELSGAGELSGSRETAEEDGGKDPADGAGSVQAARNRTQASAAASGKQNCIAKTPFGRRGPAPALLTSAAARRKRRIRAGTFLFPLTRPLSRSAAAPGSGPRAPAP